jgi:hypothetical protein
MSEQVVNMGYLRQAPRPLGAHVREWLFAIWTPMAAKWQLPPNFDRPGFGSSAPIAAVRRVVRNRPGSTEAVWKLKRAPPIRNY